MEEDKNPQQIDWGDSMEDWDSESWATHTRYGGDDDPDTDYSEDPVVNDDFEYWRTLTTARYAPMASPNRSELYSALAVILRDTSRKANERNEQ